MMRNLRILLLVLGCYLAGWVTADLLVPHIVASREQKLQQHSERLARHGDR